LWDAARREDGYISAEQFPEEHEELACGLGRALGVNRAENYVDVIERAQ